jgi:hypothetical protein
MISVHCGAESAPNFYPRYCTAAEWKVLFVNKQKAYQRDPELAGVTIRITNAKTPSSDSR